jgi:hypothetical protein
MGTGPRPYWDDTIRLPPAEASAPCNSDQRSQDPALVTRAGPSHNPVHEIDPAGVRVTTRRDGVVSPVRPDPAGPHPRRLGCCVRREKSPVKGKQRDENPAQQNQSPARPESQSQEEEGVSASAFAPPPASHGTPMEHRGEVLSAWFPALRSRMARIDTLNGTRGGAQTTQRMV